MEIDVCYRVRRILLDLDDRGRSVFFSTFRPADKYKTSTDFNGSELSSRVAIRFAELNIAILKKIFSPLSKMIFFCTNANFIILLQIE